MKILTISSLNQGYHCQTKPNHKATAGYTSPCCQQDSCCQSVSFKGIPNKAQLVHMKYFRDHAPKRLVLFIENGILKNAKGPKSEYGLPNELREFYKHIAYLGGSLMMAAKGKADRAAVLVEAKDFVRKAKTIGAVSLSEIESHLPRLKQRKPLASTVTGQQSQT